MNSTLNPSSSRRLKQLLTPEVARVYWQAIAGLRPAALRTVALTVLSGLLEGLALISLMPVLGSLAQPGGGAGLGRVGRYAAEHGWSPDMLLLAGLMGFMVLGISSALSHLGAESSMLFFRGKLEEHCRKDVVSALLRMSWPHFVVLRHGDLSKAIISETFNMNLGCYSFLDGVASALIVCAFLLLSLVISPPFTLFTVGFGLLGVVLYFAFKRFAGKFSARLSSIQTEIADRVGELFSNLKFYRGAGVTAFAERNAFRAFEDYATAYFWVFHYGTLMRAAFEVLAVIFVCSLLALNYFVFHEQIASLLIFLSLFYRMVPRLIRLQDDLFRAFSYLSWFRSWNERLNSVRAHPELPNGSDPAVFQNAITLERLSFRYPGAERTAVDNITLDIQRGECIAIVGSSGSGKTTLLDLLLGLLGPYEGRLAIGLVTQETPVFHGTILDNIAWMEQSPDRDRAWRCAERAHAAEFIARLQDGLDAPVGERGGKLSGGQRQRLAIARALYRDPHLLLLDEATSALDSDSELKVREALEDLKGSVTTVIVAHRLKSIEIADRLFVLENGRLVESGRWNELASREGGVFRRMMEAQGL